MIPFVDLKAQYAQIKPQIDAAAAARAREWSIRITSAAAS